MLQGIARNQAREQQKVLTPFNILYMGPLLYTTSNVEFCWFYNFYFYIKFDNMY
jgi:hypothetical protein